MHHLNVSTNYPWLPHNVDPSIPTPLEYVGMPIQPLGNRKKFYDDLLQSCEDHFGKEADCLGGEMERLEMSLRQAQSMVVRCVIFPTYGRISIMILRGIFRFSNFVWSIVFFCRTTQTWAFEKSELHKKYSS